MNLEEFLKPQEEEENKTLPEQEEASEGEEKETSAATEENLEIHKAVVESLAADKAEQNEMIEKLSQEKENLLNEIELLKKKIAEQNEALSKVGDVLTANAEPKESNKVALLDRDFELPDRFEGETRDHVLEAIKEARDKAEADGRIRRAQLLEGVLLANEPSGNLQKKRINLEKFFNDNQNILSGPVIAELEKYGISYKKGEEYLLTSEIITRTY